MKLIIDNQARFSVFIDNQLAIPFKTIQQKEYYDIDCNNNTITIRLVQKDNIPQKQVFSRPQIKSLFFYLEHIMVLDANQDSTLELNSYIKEDFSYSEVIYVPIVEIVRKKKITVLSIERLYSPNNHYYVYIFLFVLQLLIVYILIVIGLCVWCYNILNHPESEDWMRINQKEFLFINPIALIFYTFINVKIIVEEVNRHRIILNELGNS